MNLLFLTLLFVICSTIRAQVTSCYQNYTFTSGFFNRDYYSTSICPNNALNETLVCVRFEGVFHTLFGPSSGTVVLGDCMSMSDCEALNCSQYLPTVRAINPLFSRVETCNITCCNSNNCNGGISQYVSTSPSTTVTSSDDEPLSYDFVSNSNVSVSSCYQNYTFVSGFYNRTYLAESTCSTNTNATDKTVCVRFEGRWHTLLGSDSGSTIWGDCMPLSTCRALNCSDYVARVKRVNPLFFRLENCDITCCDSDNCNYAEIQSRTLTTTTTEPVTVPTPALRRENISALSCYQGHLLEHDLRQQNTMKPQACDLSTATEPLACVRLEAFVDLVGIEGIVDIGSCVPASTCEQLNCEDFEKERFSINPLARLTDCFVDCCTTDNCNSGGKILTPFLTLTFLSLISILSSC